MGLWIQSPAQLVPESVTRGSKSSFLVLVTVLAALADLFVLISVGLITCYAMAFWSFGHWASESYTPYFLVVGVNGLASLIVFFFRNLYTLEAMYCPRAQYTNVFYSCLFLFLLLLLLAFSLEVSAEFSRSWAFVWCLANPLAICLNRRVLGNFLRGHAINEKLMRKVAIVGGSKQGKKLADLLTSDAESANIQIVGLYDERSTRLGNANSSWSKTGNLDDLVSAARDNRVDDILVALPWSAEERLSEILNKFDTLPIDIRLCPDVVSLNYRHNSYSYYNGIPAVNLLNKPLSDWDIAWKNVFDVLVAFVLLILTLPLQLIIALLIKLDSPGDIFFIQQRFGYNQNLIEVIKFRTIYSSQQDKNAEVMITRDDSRVTRIGKILRQTSLDELPQLINVLRGDMSLVGPRPHAIKAKAAGILYKIVVSEYSIRHKVKPGITGWAQVNGWRGETDTKEKIRKRVEHDIYYINNWSILLDVKIILKTFPTIIKGGNAF